MELKDVIAIGGVSGLHKIVNHRSNGLIVETLDTTGKKFATTLTQKISVLEDIAMFTKTDDVRLGQVLLNCKAKAEEGVEIPAKNAADDALRTFMDAVLPDWDRERIYLSDVKKLATWFTILKDRLDWEAVAKNLENPEEEASEDLTAGTKAAPPKKSNREMPKVKMAAPRGPNVKPQTSAPRKTGSS